MSSSQGDSQPASKSSSEAASVHGERSRAVGRCSRAAVSAAQLVGHAGLLVAGKCVNIVQWLHPGIRFTGTAAPSPPRPWV